jgi:hypothetical protein
LTGAAQKNRPVICVKRFLKKRRQHEEEGWKVAAKTMTERASDNKMLRPEGVVQLSLLEQLVHAVQLGRDLSRKVEWIAEGGP